MLLYMENDQLHARRVPRLQQSAATLIHDTRYIECIFYFFSSSCIYLRGDIYNPRKYVRFPFSFLFFSFCFLFSEAKFSLSDLVFPWEGTSRTPLLDKDSANKDPPTFHHVDMLLLEEPFARKIAPGSFYVYLIGSNANIMSFLVGTFSANHTLCLADAAN